MMPSSRRHLFCNVQPFMIWLMVVSFTIHGVGCSSHRLVQAPKQDLPTAEPRPPQEVRTPLPPPTAVPLSDDYENYELEQVLPDSSRDFDPFTFGREGSPYGPSGIFAAGGSGSSRCGPMDMPMSSQFADPGDSQAVIIIRGNGLECIPDIDHDKPGAAITFSVVAAIFTNAPWRLVGAVTATTATITNGSVTIRFTYRITPQTTFISKVEFL